jgi:predicted amidohydrolase YtcJ
MLVVHNANIHTLDPKKPTASALAVEGEKIIAIGSDDEILQSYPKAEQINAGDRTVIPGLNDSHIHLEDFALSLQKIDCETTSRQECLDRVAARARNTPPGEWVLGHGWNQNKWPEGYGTASLLDEISPHNPVYLTHKSLHCAWANTAALKLAGISVNTPDPQDGRISHLPNGEPDGNVFEAAMQLLEQAIPAATIDQAAQALSKAIPLLWRMGLTGAHDFDGPRCFAALQVLHLRNELKFRVLKAIHLEALPHAVELGMRSGFGDDMLRIGALKLFSDGALGPQTAAMLAPYELNPGNSGMLMMDAESVFEHGRLAVDHGISLAVHAIGDLANRTVLNGYAKLREYERSHQHDPGKIRHRIEHVQVIHPDDLPRFAELDIIASMQPIHATSDMLMADRYWGARSAYAYAWQSLLANHARLIFGSDSPVESPHPFWGIHAAVTRRRADGSPSTSGWYPEQRINVSQAISAYTVSPAYAAGMENRLGRIAPGYLADLLILNKDPFTCPVMELRSIKPVVVMLGGECVFSELE